MHYMHISACNSGALSVTCIVLHQLSCLTVYLAALKTEFDCGTLCEGMLSVLKNWNYMFYLKLSLVPATNV